MKVQAIPCLLVCLFPLGTAAVASVSQSNNNPRLKRRNLSPPPSPPREAVIRMEEPTVLRYWNAFQNHAASQAEEAELKTVRTQRKLDLTASRDAPGMRQLASEYEEEGMGRLIPEMEHHLTKMQSASNKGQAWRRYGDALRRGSGDGDRERRLGKHVMQSIYRTSNSEEEIRRRIAQYQAAKMAGASDPDIFDPFLARRRYDLARMALRSQDGDRRENERKRDKNRDKIVAVVERDAERAHGLAEGYFDKIGNHNAKYEDKMNKLQRLRGKVQGWTAKADEIEGLRDVPHQYAQPQSPPSSPSDQSQEEDHFESDSEL